MLKEKKTQKKKKKKEKQFKEGGALTEGGWSCFVPYFTCCCCCCWGCGSGEQNARTKERFLLAEGTRHGNKWRLILEGILLPITILERALSQQTATETDTTSKHNNVHKTEKRRCKGS